MLLNIFFSPQCFWQFPNPPTENKEGEGESNLIEGMRIEVNGKLGYSEGKEQTNKQKKPTKPNQNNNNKKD